MIATLSEDQVRICLLTLPLSLVLHGTAGVADSGTIVTPERVSSESASCSAEPHISDYHDALDILCNTLGSTLHLLVDAHSPLKSNNPFEGTSIL